MVHSLIDLGSHKYAYSRSSHLQFCSIVRWKNATGMRDFTTIDEHVIKTLHGKNMGRWGLTCKVYRDNSRNNTGKLLYQISLAQQPRQLYCMVDGGVVVEVERDVETIFSRLKNLWVVRQSATIEASYNRCCNLST
jgi:mediator of RNA polymerase II transcription subunit 20